jgi:hypothetical protein
MNVPYLPATCPDVLYTKIPDLQGSFPKLGLRTQFTSQAKFSKRVLLLHKQCDCNKRVLKAANMMNVRPQLQFPHGKQHLLVFMIMVMKMYL